MYSSWPTLSVIYGYVKIYSCYLFSFLRAYKPDQGGRKRWKRKTEIDKRLSRRRRKTY